jgi:uncharacterized protein (DUF58 family)
MIRTATPKLGGYAALAALGLLAGLATGLPELVALAAPFALMPVLGLLLLRRPVVDVDLCLSRERLLEGEELDVQVVLGPRIGAERVDVLLELPRELGVAPEKNPRTLHVSDGRRRELEYRVSCTRWGAFRVGRVYLRTTDVFGFFRHEDAFDRRQPLKVYPTEEVVRELLRPLETQVFAGNHVARERGEGIEFADLRRFVPGDLVRRVNWRASARRSELWVNEHHAERNADVVLFLDSFAEAKRGGEGTLDRALRAAATLAARYLRQKDRVGFVTYGGMLNWLLPSTGAGQLYRIIDAMLDTEIVLSYAWKGVDVVPRRTLPPRSLILALSPLLDDRAAAALLDLRGRGFDLVVIEVSPLGFMPEPKGEVEELALRIWRLRREAVRGRFERAGVPVAVWGDETSLAVALGEVSAFRRAAVSARV